MKDKIDKRNIKAQENKFKKWSFEYWYMIIMIVYMAQMTSETSRMVGTLSGAPIPLLLPIVFTLILLKRNKISWKSKKLHFLIVVITVWIVLQLIKQRDFSTSFLSFFVFFYYAIIIAYIHVKVYREQIFRIYEDVLTKISVIGLILWVIAICVPNIDIIFRQFPETAYGHNFLYIFNWMSPEGDQYYNGIMRNAGFSWEPGRFSIMICLAILCNLCRKGVTFNNNRNQIILLITLATTQSTTGYSLALILYGIFLIKRISIRSILRFCIILVPIIFIISHLDFMYDKIIEKMEVKEYVEGFVVAEEYHSGHGGTERHISLDRFVSIYYETINFLKDPLLGYSCDFRKSNFGKTFSDDYSLTGGMIQIFGKYGLFLGLLLYGILFYSSMRISRSFRYKRRFAMAICLIISSISYPIFCIPIYTAMWLYGFFIDDSLKRYPHKIKGEKIASSTHNYK